MKLLTYRLANAEHSLHFETRALEATKAKVAELRKEIRGLKAARAKFKEA
jgi:hypothetical protein